MEKEILNRIFNSKIIAIVRDISGKDMIALAEALVKGGIDCIEVTFDQSGNDKIQESLTSISTIKNFFGGNVCVGAGTVITARQVRMAVEAGAEYIISPNTDEDVIRETKRLGKISIPGAMTATEIIQAYKYGADIVKLFPAGLLGTSYIKAIKTPIKHIPVIAVGNIDLSNCADIIKAGAAGVGVGGNLVNKKLVSKDKFDEITEIARAYVEALKS